LYRIGFIPHSQNMYTIQDINFAAHDFMSFAASIYIPRWFYTKYFSYFDRNKEFNKKLSFHDSAQIGLGFMHANL